MPHHQARPLYARHHTADVQDPGSQCADPSVQSIGVIPRRYQVQRLAGDIAKLAVGRLLPLHITIKGTFN